MLEILSILFQFLDSIENTFVDYPTTNNGDNGNDLIINVRRGGLSKLTM